MCFVPTFKHGIVIVTMRMFLAFPFVYVFQTAISITNRLLGPSASRGISADIVNEIATRMLSGGASSSINGRFRVRRTS